MAPKKTLSDIDERAREAIQSIRVAAREAAAVIAGDASTAKKVLDASSKGPKQELTDAAQDAVQAIRDAAREAAAVLAGAAEAAAKKVLDASGDGPKTQLANAAREAATSISSAAKDAAQTLATAAKDANKVLVTRADSGDDWAENRKLVMSELKRLNDSLSAGLEKVFTAFHDHDVEDTARYADINAKFAELERADTGLKVDFATVIERVDRQLWVVYGTALASLVAILFALGFHFIK